MDCEKCSKRQKVKSSGWKMGKEQKVSKKRHVQHSAVAVSVRDCRLGLRILVLGFYPTAFR